MNIAEKKKIVVVIGPGRSGTSAITRGLKVFGVDLGGNLMPPKSGVNDKGFWEDQDIYSLNRDIFKEIKHDWHRLTPVDFNILPKREFDALKLRAIEVIRNKTKTTNLFGMKDPQITRLLPFWREVFAYLSLKDTYVIACRNPMNVARSLSKYTGFSLVKSYLLWFENTFASLIASEGANRVVVSYDFLMQNPLAQLQRIGSALDLQVDANGNDFYEYSSQFLDAKLRHNEFQIDDLLSDGDVPPKCIMLYELILKFATDAIAINSQNAIQEINRFKSIHHGDSFLQKCVQNLEDKQSATFSELVERDAQLVQLNQTVSGRDGHIASLMQTVESLIIDRDSKNAGLTQLHGAFTRLSQERDEQTAQLNQVIAARNEEIFNLKQTIKSLIIDRDSQNAGFAQLRDAFTRLSQERDEHVAQLNHVVATRDERIEKVNMELSALYKSKSWRLTTPLRKLVWLGRELLAFPFRRGGQNAHSPAPASVLVPESPCSVLCGVKAMPKENSFRILLVSYYCPTRAHAGGLRILDIYALIRRHCPDIQLDLFTYHRPSIDWSLDEIYRLFDNVYFSPVEDLTAETLVDLRGAPLTYDVVDLQFHQSAYHINEYKKISKKIIFTPMECAAKVLFLELRSKLQVRNFLRFRKLPTLICAAAEEIVFAHKVDQVVCVSSTDAAFLRMLTSSKRICGIDTCVSQFEFREALASYYEIAGAINKPISVLYVAYFGSETNVLALLWYLEHVHPLIKARVPDYTLKVVGRGDLSPFFKYREKSIEFVGEVPAISPYIKEARVSIAPALGGSGFRGKVNQYAVLGCPCVVSPIAFKGLSYQDGVNIFIAKTPEMFADRCVQLLTDTELNDRIGKAARQLCMERYTWQSKWVAIRKIYKLEVVE